MGHTAEILFGFETELVGVVENHRLRVKSTRNSHAKETLDFRRLLSNT